MNEALHYIERNLLKAVLLDNTLLAEIDLKPFQFGDATAAQVYSAILDLIRDSKPADTLSVGSHLESITNSSWTPYMLDLHDSTIDPSRDSAIGYIESIKQKHLERAAKRIGRLLVENPGEISTAIQHLMDLSNSDGDHEFSTSEAVDLGLAKIDELCSGIPALPTGIEKLDEMLGGFHKQDLIVFAGRPAMGKTALMLNCAIGANKPVGVISAEQGVEQIALRLFSITGQIDGHRMRLGKMESSDYNRLADAATLLRKSNIQIWDKPLPHLSEVQRIARKWKWQYNIQALYVDYLQHIQNPSSDNRTQQVGQISKVLKAIARELDIPVVAMAQLNRGVESRDVKRPRMGDLRESGEIEQDADQVILLYRDVVYNPDTEYPKIMELIVDKNRHGPTGYVKAIWEEKYMQLRNMTFQDNG